MDEIETSRFSAYYIDHTVGIWPQAVGGIHYNPGNCEHPKHARDMPPPRFVNYGKALLV